MAMIIDIKNAIRKAIYTRDNNINFFFNEILKVEYPYVFFYIPSYKLNKAVNTEGWQRLTLMCVVEYAKSENNSTTELWNYSDILSGVYSVFEFANTKINAQNIEFKTVEGVLQMTFDLDFYVKLLPQEQAELMEELELSILKENEYGINSTEI
jgi:hypothetical protein